MILVPFGTNGLLGAVFSSVGRPELPKPKILSSDEHPTNALSPSDDLYHAMLRDRLLNATEHLLSMSSPKNEHHSPLAMDSELSDWMQSGARLVDWDAPVNFSSISAGQPPSDLIRTSKPYDSLHSCVDY